jgi:hypothetical protein
MLGKQLRFRDLKAKGIVDNWVTLTNWINTQDFPPGKKAGPNTRLWDETAVVAWLEARPLDRKAPPPRRVAEKVA